MAASPKTTRPRAALSIAPAGPRTASPKRAMTAAWPGVPAGQEYSVKTTGAVHNAFGVQIGNPQGVDFLLRDCANMGEWFRARGLEVDEQDLFGDLMAHAF